MPPDNRPLRQRDGHIVAYNNQWRIPSYVCEVRFRQVTVTQQTRRHPCAHSCPLLHCRPQAPYQGQYSQAPKVSAVPCRGAWRAASFAGELLTDMQAQRLVVSLLLFSPLRFASSVAHSPFSTSLYSEKVDRQLCVFGEDPTVHPYFRSNNKDYS